MVNLRSDPRCWKRPKPTKTDWWQILSELARSSRKEFQAEIGPVFPHTGEKDDGSKERR